MQTTDPKAEWLNTVAHDLKTPINSVRGCLELVQQLGPLNERQRHFADKAMSGLQRMEHLVSRLLDISWIDADMQLDLAACDLRAILNEVVELLHDAAERQQIVIHQDVLYTEPIIADAHRLFQVVENLVSNALKYNHDGGQIWVQAAQRQDWLLVSVKDSGMGILPEDQPRVFDRFFRAREGVARKIEGSGLGLAISKAIVHKHGGQIWLESVPGKGSTFYFTLPLHVISEGGDRLVEAQQEAGEGFENRFARLAGLASEEHDALPDDIQETREIPQDASSSDEM